MSNDQTKRKELTERALNVLQRFGLMPWNYTTNWAYAIYSLLLSHRFQRKLQYWIVAKISCAELFDIFSSFWTKLVDLCLKRTFFICSNIMIFCLLHKKVKAGFSMDYPPRLFLANLAMLRKSFAKDYSQQPFLFQLYQIYS